MSSTLPAVATPAEVLTSRSPRQLAWRRFKKNKVGLIAGATSLFFILAAAFAPLIAMLINVDPNERDGSAIKQIELGKIT